jgi:hypothetical protein
MAKEHSLMISMATGGMNILFACLAAVLAIARGESFRRDRLVCAVVSPHGSSTFIGGWDPGTD